MARVGVRRFFRRLGELQAALLLSLLYLLLWIPAGLLSRLLADWLRRRPPSGSSWWPRRPRVNDPAHLRDPF
ncbi:MAG: hypothetical protein HYZ93_04325 [Candidatus Omnitrophica bacterium]|nr:hypothetical protein [Candidatus Omnitrophota bacterium]